MSRWDDTSKVDVYKDIRGVMEYLARRSTHNMVLVVGPLTTCMLKNGYKQPDNFVCTWKRPRVKMVICGHESIMPRWCWRLLKDIQDMRNKLHFAWWTEQHPEYWRIKNERASNP